MIYLDHAATAPVPLEVAEEMYTILREHYGNPSSQYASGLDMKKRLEGWRQTIASAMGCPPERLFFTSCGTEGDNWAIRAAISSPPQLNTAPCWNAANGLPRTVMKSPVSSQTAMGTFPHSRSWRPFGQILR